MASLLSKMKTSNLESNTFVPISTGPLYKLITHQENDEVDVKKIKAPPELNVEVSKLKNLEELVNQLKEHIENFYESRGRKRKHSSEDVDNLRLQYYARHSYGVEAYINQGLTKCLHNDGFWCVKSFKVLVKNNLISARSHNLACGCILKFKSFDVLDHYSKKEKIFTEEFIVKCIKEIVGTLKIGEIKKFSKYTCAISKLDPFISNLVKLVVLPYDESQLQSYMKLLSNNEAMVVLQVLHGLIPHLSGAFRCEGETLTLPPDLTIGKIIGWLNCLLSAKLPSFLVSTQLQSIVVEISKTIKKQENYYRDISTLRPCLERIETKRKPQEENTGKYSIEKIFL